MKKTALLALITFLCAQFASADDIRDDLSRAIDAQKKASENARWDGFIGMGLDLAGYVVVLNGMPKTSTATTSAEATQNANDATAVVLLGGGLVLAGAVTSFLGWLAQLDANDRQAEVNALLLSSADHPTPAP